MLCGCPGATYRSLEFGGEVISQLSMEERQTLCNMAIEAGGKNGIIAADETTESFLRSRTSKPYEIFNTDRQANFYADRKYKLEELEPVSPDHRH